MPDFGTNGTTLAGMVLTFISTIIYNWWKDRRETKKNKSELAIKLENLEKSVSEDLWERAKVEIDDLSKDLDAERRARRADIAEFDAARLAQQKRFEQQLGEQAEKFKLQLELQKRQFIKVLQKWQGEMRILKSNLAIEKASRIKEVDSFNELLEGERAKRRILATKVEKLLTERGKLRNALRALLKENVELKRLITDCKDSV